MTATATMKETRDQFDCFGGRCAVLVMGDAETGSAPAAVAGARRSLLAWHERFSRFIPGSELCQLNDDPAETVAVRPLMAALAQAAVLASRLSGGLVDATLVTEIERAGYARHFDTPSLPLSEALRLAPKRQPAHPHPAARWRRVIVDRPAGTVTRAPGVRLDSGGVAKGLFADLLASRLAAHAAFAVDCGGDLRIGGSEGLPRPVQVTSPFDGSVLHELELRGGGVATSGIGRRSWLDDAGRPAHHLLDPATGRPAYTGVVQATALAPSAVEAEARAKAAVLSGPGAARAWLPHGGVVVLDDGSHRVLPAAHGHNEIGRLA
jgi:thiamine biosynthesis lipoprotein